jgi:integrative and conjugative element protein (TIGR02256 family)
VAPRDAAPDRMRYVLAAVTPRVVLAASAHASIEAVCAEATDGLETGGILLGHQHADGHLTVTVAGDPGRRAERRRRSFRRDHDHAQALAGAAYAHDRRVWVGDWHTHPLGPEHPSPVDLRSYGDVLSDQDLGFEMFLSIIAVPSTPRPLLWSWIVTSTTITPAGMWVLVPDGNERGTP